MTDSARCDECGHDRAGHRDDLGGICIGCPCSGWREPAVEPTEAVATDDPCTCDTEVNAPDRCCPLHGLCERCGHGADGHTVTCETDLDDRAVGKPYEYCWACQYEGFEMDVTVHEFEEEHWRARRARLFREQKAAQ